MENGEFWIDGITENFKYIKHNETDYEGFRDFQQSIDERFKHVERKRAREERTANLEKWDNSLPERWRSARFAEIKKPVARKILESLKSNPRGTFFLTGESGSGKTFVAYATIRRMIGQGTVTFHQITTVSESVLSNWAARGFQGQDQLATLMNGKTKLYLFDGIGTLDEKESLKVAPIWDQLIDHIYRNDLIAIFTSVDDLDRFTEYLSPSGETKLRTLIASRNLTVEFDGSKASKKR